MIWNKYTIKTTTEAEDAVAAMLMEMGVQGVEINDSVPPTDEEFEAMYIDPQPELMPDYPNKDVIDDGVAELSFYIRLADDTDDQRKPAAGVVSVSAGDDTPSNIGIDDSYTIHDKLWTRTELDELLENIKCAMQELSQYCDVGSGTIEAGQSDEVDWRDNWKNFYKPLVVGRILAKPEWEAVPEECAKAVESGDLKLVALNPGNAFGTGSHETTRLALEAISKYVESGDRVLDIGAGSGILGISALKLGAEYIHSTEIDPACEHIMKQNAELNDVDSECFDIKTGNILTDDDVIMSVQGGSPEGYDIAVANILAPVIIELAASGAADRFVKNGGIFITTGIIDSKEKDVAEAFNNNPAWNIIETGRLGDWVSVIARRN